MSTWPDDMRAANGTLLQPIVGTTLVDTPEHMTKGFVYGDDRFFARTAADYVPSRYLA